MLPEPGKIPVLRDWWKEALVKLGKSSRYIKRGLIPQLFSNPSQ
jgi:hypothetical protein